MYNKQHAYHFICFGTGAGVGHCTRNEEESLLNTNTIAHRSRYKDKNDNLKSKQELPLSSFPMFHLIITRQPLFKTSHTKTD